MSQATPTSTAEGIAQRDIFAERLLQSTLGLFDIYTIYIGDRLGLYAGLASNGAVTSAELAERTGTHERYVREWLEQQAVSGIVQVEHLDVGGETRRFRLPAGHAEVLVESDSLNYLAPLARIAVGAARPVTSVVDAFRRGGGVPYADYGGDLREGQAGMNRAAFLQELGREWLPSIPNIHDRLQADPPARVADVGCGFGWSSIGMAQAYPKIHVDGFDLDEPSVEAAKANAADAGVDGRASFHARDAGDLAADGQYDLVTAFECVHDMSNPVEVLRTMRRLAGDNGAVVIVDERVGEKFDPNAGDVEQMMYGWSVLHCLPVGLAEQPSVGTGTVMREGTLRRYAIEAGFQDVEVLPIESLFFRFYQLHS